MCRGATGQGGVSSCYWCQRDFRSHRRSDRQLFYGAPSGEEVFDWLVYIARFREPRLGRRNSRRPDWDGLRISGRRFELLDGGTFRLPFALDTVLVVLCYGLLRSVILSSFLNLYGQRCALVDIYFYIRCFGSIVQVTMGSPLQSSGADPF